MRLMGLQAIYPKPKTSTPAPGHKRYPYLLRGLKITHPCQVWSTDITYVPLRGGFMYVVAVIDWYSRYVPGLATVEHPGWALLSGRALAGIGARQAGHL